MQSRSKQRFLLQRVVYNDEEEVESLKCSFLMHPASFFPPLLHYLAKPTDRPTDLPPLIQPFDPTDHYTRNIPRKLHLLLLPLAPNLDEIKTHRNVFSFHPRIRSSSLVVRVILPDLPCT